MPPLLDSAKTVAQARAPRRVINMQKSRTTSAMTQRRLPPCICCSWPGLSGGGSKHFSTLSGHGASEGISEPESPEVLDDYIKKIKIGNITAWLLRDGTIEIPLDKMFPSVTASDWKPFTKSQPDGTARLSSGCVLVQVPRGDKYYNILLDAGLGIVDPPYMPTTDLRALLLRAAGVTPEDINYVVFSHLHRDHTGWAVMHDSSGHIVPTFPNAIHCVQAKEWDFWNSSDDTRTRTRFHTFLTPLEARGIVSKHNGETSLVPGVDLIPFNGHTPGHQVTKLHSLGQTAIFIGDALHHTAQIQKPHWSPIFDWDKAISESNRVALLTLADSESARLLSPHFPFPGVGRVHRQCDNSFTWKPDSS
eukprot:CAMPEP_0167742350 /NCGR_PEP_ID=MMETSP0110_2-20121227/1377_1 /TAXON_ID=629695 /ORGANISM="Gymnochlora sp., Strain CCMP2014" /LENGTH=362 /DNA_ID=CAMNT_0007626531 /DNA_START=137 /DNA_END=1225 /DNA_ORIENTATION=-